jgi:hypothetical protein
MTRNRCGEREPSDEWLVARAIEHHVCTSPYGERALKVSNHDPTWLLFVFIVKIEPAIWIDLRAQFRAIHDELIDYSNAYFSSGGVRQPFSESIPKIMKNIGFVELVKFIHIIDTAMINTLQRENGLRGVQIQ